MAGTEVDKGKNTDAVAMAKSIVSSQTEQITQMQDRLASMGTAAGFVDSFV
jgi:uncharacterized protein (DUF305 family)